MELRRLPCSRNTFGEALITLATFGGFLALLWQGKVSSWQDIAMYAAIMGIVAGFYFLLLLFRALFIFVVGADGFLCERSEKDVKVKR